MVGVEYRCTGRTGELYKRLGGGDHYLHVEKILLLDAKACVTIYQDSAKVGMRSGTN